MTDGINTFEQTINDILDIPGVNKKTLAEWAGVDPSSVTRWTQGVSPSDPIAILRKLAPEAERAREAIHSYTTKTSVPSWKSLTVGMSTASAEYAKSTGLLAETYYAVSCWTPASLCDDLYDVVVHRYCRDVWADTSRDSYNVGDISQTASLVGTEPPRFDQERALTKTVTVNILRTGNDDVIDNTPAQQLKHAPRDAMARLHVQLELDDFGFPSDVIGSIGDIGYRFRATRTIVKHQTLPRQTNEYLGAPIVVPCKRLKLFVCIPASCFRGSPSALSSSNRSMFPLLMELDNIPPGQIESLLWPLGKKYDWSASPDAQLKTVPRVANEIEEFPQGLRESLGAQADLDAKRGESVRDIMCREDSRCFLLDIRDPHPSLTYSIVWRLNPASPEHLN